MEHNIEINGISICYEQQGSGRPVILLHGNGGSHHTFDGLIERLAAFYTVYAPDSRGHGHSGKAGPLSYEQLASDTAELIQALWRVNRPRVASRVREVEGAGPSPVARGGW